MLATPVSRQLSSFPLLLAMPFLIVLGAVALSTSDTEPLWPVDQAEPLAAQSCVMMLSEMGPPPAESAQGCARKP